MNKGIIARIETVIEHLELSVSAFADEIGVQRSSISHLLNGRNKPSLDFVMKLVNTYPEVDLYWLLKGEGRFPKESTNQAEINGPKITKEVDNPHLDDFAIPSSKEKKRVQQSKNPYKVVMFYSDGTFEVYNTKKD
ncbi:helix-turn-helix domain protein [Allomuricauda ruestringensis DSM 13258]|uniref:Helix-turn-helix domain protein n=1 Tax=Allomuricauda ruestringensis (strain DSM 13258 / CIP 107369 / LMG 19739 / B1) TaxID=886377 RepID=G2PKQ3_ALLRU|nr:helix-turn-helix transcriptional regulator [Allomuricauda ruestringensis]AEM72099.1 helix-turn-helix domain protein [Allomuricauda ruestringensis DSM 13258]